MRPPAVGFPGRMALLHPYKPSILPITPGVLHTWRTESRSSPRPPGFTWPTTCSGAPIRRPSAVPAPSAPAALPPKTLLLTCGLTCLHGSVWSKQPSSKSLYFSTAAWGCPNPNPNPLPRAGCKHRQQTTAPLSPSSHMLSPLPGEGIPTRVMQNRQKFHQSRRCTSQDMLLCP